MKRTKTILIKQTQKCIFLSNVMIRKNLTNAPIYFYFGILIFSVGPLSRSKIFNLRYCYCEFHITTFTYNPLAPTINQNYDLLTTEAEQHTNKTQRGLN
jgi:hypothetical protein